MIREGISYRFTRALVRSPGKSVINGLRALDRGRPDADLFRIEHNAYREALKQAGLKLTALPPLEQFPDSVFVEDTALCLPEGFIILNPGAASRTAEAKATASALSSLQGEIFFIGENGFIDGGDILVTDSTILAGLSTRTNQTGIDALNSILRRWDYSVQAVQTPENVLHFKSDCCVLDSETILATSRLSKAACFEPFRVLTVPNGEEAAANTIRVNETVLVPAGFPATAELLVRENYSVQTVPVSQAALLDGGLSCMSLRFAPALE